MLATRPAIGGFFVWGVWDNITGAEHMRKFATFLKQVGFSHPEAPASLDVGVQLVCGLRRG